MNSSKLATRLVLTLSVVLVLITVGGSKAAAAVRTVANGTSAPCTGTFTTISAAVAAASPGDTIQVCPGTYTDLVMVTKTLTILGAQAGVDARTRTVPLSLESVVNASGGNGVFVIKADNVVIDGFIIQGVVNDPCANPSSFGAGIWTDPGSSGTQGGHQLRNNIIQNNTIGIELNNTGTLRTTVDHNLILNNNFANCGGGSGGITTNAGTGLQNAVIDSNKIQGHTTNGGMYNFGTAVATSGKNVTVSNNEFVGNRRAIGLETVSLYTITGNNIHNSVDSTTGDIRLFGVDQLSITCNNIFDGAGRGIWISLDPGFAGPSSNITIHLNNIAGNAVAGLVVDTGSYTPATAGSLKADNNWWGSASGPTIASNPGGTGDKIVDPDGVVTYKPFLTVPSDCGPPDNFLVNYFSGARGSRPDQTVRIINPGTATETRAGDPSGSFGPETADLCANIYVFSPDQQLAECCSCFVSPNGLRTLSVDFDLANNPLTPVTLGEGVIKIVASPELVDPTSKGVCLTASGISVAASNYDPVAALRAWGVHNQDVSSPGSLSGAGVINWVTETHFLNATLSNAELKSLQTNCLFIQNQGSGHGKCTCGRGD